MDTMLAEHMFYIAYFIMGWVTLIVLLALNDDPNDGEVVFLGSVIWPITLVIGLIIIFFWITVKLSVLLKNFIKARKVGN